jgi:hypothetical protein
MAKYNIGADEWYPVLVVNRNTDGSYRDDVLAEIPDELIAEIELLNAAFKDVQRKLSALSGGKFSFTSDLIS